MRKHTFFLFIQMFVWFSGGFLARAQQQMEFNEELWSPSLTQELKIQYRERFGQVDAGSIDLQQGPYSQLEQDNQKRRDFAEYTVKRFSEVHVDDYIKTKPEMRSVYETKEKISNIQVKVSEEFRFQMKYNFAGNVVYLILHNPYCDSRISVEMDPHAFGPTPRQETKVIVGKDIDKFLRVHSVTEQNNGITSLGLLSISQNWTRTVTTSTYFSPVGTSVRENRLSVGLGTAF